MKKKLIIKTITFFLYAGVNAYAGAPTIFTKHPEDLKGIIKSHDAELVADDANRNAFYVLPPATAYAYLTDYDTPNASTVLCSSLAEAGKTAEIYAKQKSVYAEQSQLFLQQEEWAYEQYIRAKRYADQFATSSEVASKINEFDEKISSDQMRLDVLYEKSKNCETACLPLHVEINELKISIAKLKNSRAYYKQQNLNDAREYERRFQASETMKNAWIKKKNQQIELQTEIEKLETLITNSMRRYAALEGVFGHIQYKSDWEEKLEQLIKNNPDKSFEKMNTTNVTMFAQFVPADSVSYLNSMPSILSYSVLGRPASERLEFSSYPSSVQVDVRLSLAGTCPLIRPDLFPAQGVNSKLKFGIGTTYQYYSSFNTKAHFTYNASQFYQKVMRAGRSGFLFWKKNWEETNIDLIEKAAFNFQWDLSDPTNQLTFNERRKVEGQAISWVISNMLSKYGKPNVDNPSTNLPPVPNSGLSEVAQGLYSICGSTNIYCTAASWVMKSLDEIIGSGQSTGTVRQNFESTAQVSWDDKTLQLVSGMTSYLSDKPAVNSKKDGVNP